MTMTKNSHIFEIVNRWIQYLYGCKSEQLYDVENNPQLKYIRGMSLAIFKKYMTVQEISRLTLLNKDFINNQDKEFHIDKGLAKMYEIICEQIIV